MIGLRQDALLLVLDDKAEFPGAAWQQPYELLGEPRPRRQGRLPFFIATSDLYQQS